MFIYLFYYSVFLFYFQKKKDFFGREIDLSTMPKQKGKRAKLTIHFSISTFKGIHYMSTRCIIVLYDYSLMHLYFSI